jgi:chorismate lyase/3-hydroxybenzoate synthase
MTPFSIFYDDDAQTEAWLNNDRLLALIRFDESAAVHLDPRVTTVTLPELGGTATVEVWLSTHPVQTGAINGVQYADNGDTLFLQCMADEAAPDALSVLTATAYQRLFAVARERGYRRLLRIWNYFPAINQKVGDLERYRAFCVGRHWAFQAERAELESHLPAASAIGATPSLLPLSGGKVRGGGLRLYALVSRDAGVQIENPRQISAFHYPRQYGPQSPSFSRAILKPWGPQAAHLYISGTASVVGHASQHGDLMAQLDETLMNLEALLAEAKQRVAPPLKLALLRIYLRPDIDPTPLRIRIAQVFGAAAPLLFLRADICRRELLIEIEGLATQDPAA